MKDKRVAFVLLIVLVLLFFFIKPSSVEGNVTNNVSSMQQAVEEQQVEGTQPTVEVQEVEEVVEELQVEEEQEPEVTQQEYVFRNKKLLNDHYDKHGREMGFDSPQDYQSAASAVINNPNALNKIESEDGDYVYYLEETNEFVVLSTDGYIRTYFLPNAGRKYYDRQ